MRSKENWEDPEPKWLLKDGREETGERCGKAMCWDHLRQLTLYARDQKNSGVILRNLRKETCRAHGMTDDNFTSHREMKKPAGSIQIQMSKRQLEKPISS